MNIFSKLEAWLRAVAERPLPFTATTWLQDDDIEIFVRRGYRNLPRGGKTLCLELANIFVENRGRGYFTGFLPKFEALNPCPATFIENVLELPFQKFFLRNGYEEVPNSEPTCFYKLKAMEGRREESGSNA